LFNVCLDDLADSLLRHEEQKPAILTGGEWAQWITLIIARQSTVLFPGRCYYHEPDSGFSLMIWLKATCHLDFHVEICTPLVLMLRPRSGAQQWVARESYTLSPFVPVVEYTDIYGNLCQRLVAPLGKFSIHTSAEVMTANEEDTARGACFVEVQNLPESVLTYLLPSRYCESDRLGALARDIVTWEQPGYDQVSSIDRWIRSNIHYTPGSSNFPISAVEVNARCEGVCRDLAHLGIALCRSISIPARLVAGYLYGLQPMDLHAWFEAYTGGRWYTFDPTQNEINGGRIAIAYGRDAADVSIFHQFGAGEILTDMAVHVESLPGAPGPESPPFL
jgi:transglutaminase-like putative cysteine protease